MQSIPYTRPARAKLLALACRPDANPHRDSLFVEVDLLNSGEYTPVVFGAFLKPSTDILASRDPRADYVGPACDIFWSTQVC